MQHHNHYNIFCVILFIKMKKNDRKRQKAYHRFLVKDSKLAEQKRAKQQKRNEFRQMKKDFDSGLSLDEPVIRDVEMKEVR